MHRTAGALLLVWLLALEVLLAACKRVVPRHCLSACNGGWHCYQGGNCKGAWCLLRAVNRKVWINECSNHGKAGLLARDNRLLARALALHQAWH